MAKLITKGDDKLLRSLGHDTRYKAVKLSPKDEAIIRYAINVLEQAAELEDEVLGAQGIYEIGENKFKVAWRECLTALDEDA